MLIAFLVCPSGLGHFSRVMSLVDYLNSVEIGLEIHIWCEDWQRKSYLKNNYNPKNIIFHYGCMQPGVEWSLDPEIYDDGRITSWETRIANESILLSADIVISDNLVGALNIRQDTVLMGSFLWSDIFEKAYPSNNTVQEFIYRERFLLEKYNPDMLCLADLAMPGVLNRTNALPLPWMCTESNINEIPKSKKPRISVQIGLTEAMKNWAAFIIPLLTSISDYEMYLPEYLMKYVPAENSDNVQTFNFTQYDDYASRNVVICRPGVGTLTACIGSDTPMILVYEEENAEMGHNAECIQKLGLGFDMGFEWDETEIIKTVKILLNPHIYRRTKSRIQSAKKDGLKIASDWILDKVYNQ